jgi:hypothetical protein
VQAFINGYFSHYLIEPLKANVCWSRLGNPRSPVAAFMGLADLREPGETCGKHRVAKIMKANKIIVIRGYKKPGHVVGRQSIIAPNRLNREFTGKQPDSASVTDITNLRTWQGWLYLACH